MARTVYKPAGLPVFPPHADPSGDCVLSRVLAEEPHRGAIPWPSGFEGGIAHRLDNSTSGALVVADTPDELTRIRAWFHEKRLEKIYRFRSDRDPPWAEHRCDRPLAHDPRHKGRMVVQRGRSTPHRGKWHEAITFFLKLAPGLYEARMCTGVMHQIRVHAAFVGVPLRGDSRYGGARLRGGEFPGGIDFLLHHVGLVGPEGFRSGPVPTPAWAQEPR